MSTTSFPTPTRYLETPGDPVAPFRVWFGLLENYLYMIDRNRKPDDKLSDADKNRYVFSLLGMEGCRLFASNPLALKQSETTHVDCMTAVRSQFEKPVNTVRAHVDFFQRKQGESESAPEFLSSLRMLAADCDFREQEDKFLAIQLINGCRCSKTRVKLLEETTPDLSKVFGILQAAETATQTDTHLRSGQSSHVNAVKYSSSSFPSTAQKGRKGKKNQAQGSFQGQGYRNHICYGCGRSDHAFKDPKCPASGKMCDFCGNVGHFVTVCRNKKRQEERSYQGIRGQNQRHFQGQGQKQLRCITVNTVSQQDAEKFHMTVKVHSLNEPNPVPIAMMVDSGSDVSAIPYEMYQMKFGKFPLSPVQNDIENYTGGKIACYGTFDANMDIDGKEVKGTVWVLANNCSPILGIPEIRSSRLNLFPTETIRNTNRAKSFEEILKDYPNLTSPGIGTFPGYKHKIQLRPDAVPCAYKCRPIPVHKLEKVKKAVFANVEEGIWSALDKADWVHPLMVVDKPDGDVRITTDLRGLNKFIVPNRYPLPRIKDVFQKVQGSTIFTTIDLKKAYHTIELDQESRPLTATITPWGLFAYNKLPMGMMDSGNVFQQRANETLEDSDNSEDFVDDCIIHSVDPRDHEKHVRDVLSRLNEKDFRINIKKCKYAQSEVPYLGFVISKDGIKPNPKKLEALSEFPSPKSIPETRRFIGMANTYRHFVPSFASLVEPIQALLRKDREFQWSDRCESAFCALKERICSASSNAIFDRNAPTFVTTDASDCGLGAVLSQLQNDVEVPIEFASHTLEEHERSYAANELEAYACVWACEHWSDYLIGVHFTLRTDCQALTSILNPLKPPTAKYKLNKFQRWVDRLSMFSYNVEHQKGSLNAVADALSRSPVKSTGEAIPDPIRISLLDRNQNMGISLPSIQEATKADPVLQKVEEYTRKEGPKKAKLPPELLPYYPIRDEITCDEKFLTRSHGRIILPTVLVDTVLILAHKGHPGIVQLKRKIRETYWWPKFSESIENKVRYCGPCQGSAKSDANPPRIDASLPVAREPWELISVDITGPFHIAPTNMQYLLVLVDHYSGYPEVSPTGSISSVSIKAWLSEIFSRHGCPSVLLSDNGTQFTSEDFEAFLRNQDIRHIRSPVYTPQSNGKVEVLNRYLKHGLQAVPPGLTFMQALNELLASFRATPHSDKNPSPAESFLGRRMRLSHEPNRLNPPRPEKAIDKETQEITPPNLLRRGPFHVGDKVLMKRPQVLKGQSPWSSPVEVREVLGNYTYRLSNGSVWSSRKLKRFHPPEEEPMYADLLATEKRPGLPTRVSSRCNKGIQPLRYQAGQS